MNAKDYRIGNLVHYEVEGTLELCTLDGYDIYSMEGNQSYCDEHIPIPLTEEWLLKFGFVKNKKSKDYQMQLETEDRWLVIMIIQDNFYPVAEQLGELSHQRGNLFHFNCIQYVHQLQNLYFALTETELEKQR